MISVTVQLEVNKARLDEYLAIIESMEYCGIIRFPTIFDEDLSKFIEK